jgi:hypothetical protein
MNLTKSSPFSNLLISSLYHILHELFPSVDHIYYVLFSSQIFSRCSLLLLLRSWFLPHM